MCAPACNESTAVVRYYFHVRDGRDLPDDVGTELPDMPAVRQEAIKAAGEMLRDAASFWTGEEWHMTVLDDAGAQVLALRFSAEG
jgi:hypothetical protein